MGKKDTKSAVNTEKENKQINEEIGERLRNFRKSLNLSQNEFSAALDITDKQYGNIERGLSSLSLDKILRLNEEYGLDPTYLITGRKSPSDILSDYIKDCPKDKIFDFEQMIRYASNLYRNEDKSE